MNVYIKAMSLMVLVFSFMVLTGCATIFKGSTQDLNVTSNVDGADVYINNQLVGQTPFSGTIEKEKSITLRVSKDGYKDQQMVLAGKIEGWFWGNIISGGVGGSLIDFITGSMWKVRPNTYNVDLQPEGE